MLYVLDTADLEAIGHFCEFYPISGVTTNPSIIAKEKAELLPHLKKIRNIIGNDRLLCVQTLEGTAEGMAADAEALRDALGGNLYIKIPISEAGLKATPIIKSMGIGVLMTAIFTSAQALVSAMAGADFVAPYVNRIDNAGGNGVGVVEEIVRQFKTFGTDCRVLAASFKNVSQVNACANAGCHSVTVSPEIMRGLISHPLTDVAVEGFEKDWRSVYGDSQVADLLRKQ
ncbi:MAG: transaldolase family protein [Eubacteriales bacterium]